jgi:hypothetical protein
LRISCSRRRPVTPKGRAGGAEGAGGEEKDVFDFDQNDDGILFSAGKVGEGEREREREKGAGGEEGGRGGGGEIE